MMRQCYNPPKISIHALREESDRRPETAVVVGDAISIHALREEGDLLLGAGSSRDHEKFLSTPSARRATLMNRLLGMGGYDISIHALREEGDQRHQPCHHAGGISIHALREEGDSPHFFVLVARRVFLSTPSVRRATY